MGGPLSVILADMNAVLYNFIFLKHLIYLISKICCLVKLVLNTSIYNISERVEKIFSIWLEI